MNNPFKLTIFTEQFCLGALLQLLSVNLIYYSNNNKKQRHCDIHGSSRMVVVTAMVTLLSNSIHCTS